MSDLSFAVLGLGRFGKSVAIELSRCGCEVIAVDKNPEWVAEVADDVAYAAAADIMELNALKKLGIGNVDGAIVAIGDDLEASVMSTLLLKEMGIPYIMAKVQNETCAKILKKVGADAVTLPETEMGVRIARNLVGGNFLDLVELSSKFSIVEMEIPETWVGKTLKELDLRGRYGINIIALKTGEDVDVNLDPDDVFNEGAKVVLAGENDSLLKVK